MPKHETINYVELPSKDLAATKQFFATVFGWKFTDYGPDYMSFESPTLEGGFFRAELASSTSNGATLIVFYSDHIEDTQQRIEAAGGEIVRPIFEFPGGRRFHFLEPSGNEFAVWGLPVDSAACEE